MLHEAIEQSDKYIDILNETVIPKVEEQQYALQLELDRLQRVVLSETLAALPETIHHDGLMNA